MRKRCFLTHSAATLLAGTSILYNSAHAQTTAPDSSLNCNAAGTLYFNNGIKTKFGEARVALNRIKSDLPPSLSIDERSSLTYELAYNESAGAISDIWEAYKQRYGLQNVRLLQFIQILTGITSAPKDVQDFLSNEIAKRITAQRVSNADLGKFVQLYKNAIGSGRKVIVVAHSQGNFFANQSYNSLTAAERRSFAIVSVANPDTQVADGGPYVTLHEDLLILALRTLGLSPANSNTTNGLLNPVPFGHGFMDAYYVFNTTSANKINMAIASRYHALEAPAALFAQGAIRATLTWGSQPDVDLHVYEPAGSHVYYSAKRGASGFLDLDDTTSFGPENYFVSCPTVQTGTYSIGVNYFSGSAPERAKVEVRAGTATQVFEQSLATAVGSAGNQSPAIVAKVVVTRDQAGTNSYLISAP